MEFESSCQSNCNRRCDRTFYNDAKEEQHKHKLPKANVHSDIIWKGTAGNSELVIALPQWYGYPRVLSIPILKTLVIWISSVTLTLTLTQIAKVVQEGDAHITRVLGMGLPKTRGCPYHWNSATLETRRNLGRVNFRKDFWDCCWGRRKDIGQLLVCSHVTRRPTFVVNTIDSFLKNLLKKGVSSQRRETLLSLVTNMVAVTFVQTSNRDFKIQRRGRRRERPKSNRFYKQNNSFARASHFFCTFLSRFCTTTTWKCLISCFMENVNKQRRIIFLFLSFDMVPWNSASGGFAYIWQSI